MRFALGLLVTAALFLLLPAAGSSAAARPEPSIEAFGSGNVALVVVPEVPCQELAPARLTIELFEEDFTSVRLVRTFTLDSPCAARWKGDFKPLPHLVFGEVLLERGPATPPSISLDGRGRRPGTVKWPIRVSRDGAVIVEGTLVLVIKRQRRRVYEGSKAFRTHCVRKHRRIKTKRGRRYCLRPVIVRKLDAENR